MDMTKENVITVTNQNGQQHDYKVVAEIRKSAECALTKFRLKGTGLSGVINEGGKTISLVTDETLGEQLAGGTQDGRGQRLGERARNRRGAQERTQGTSGGDEAPARSQGAQQRQTEGDSPRTASRRRGDRGAGRETAAQWRRNGHGGSA